MADKYEPAEMAGSVLPEINHTPLPYYNHEGTVWVAASRANYHTGEEEEYQQPLFDAGNDAEFIVRACNSHYELLGVACDLRGRLNALRPDMRRHNEDTSLKLCNAAIAKAENKDG